MPYLIDGHNLIPKLGLHLHDPEDEMKLVERLQTFCRVRRKTVEVYFDGAPAGQVGARSFGAVKAHFVAQHSNADAAIKQRLRKMGKSAKNWQVVTSDRQVQAEAHACGADVLAAEAFADDLINAERTAPPDPRGRDRLSEAEVQEWMRLFSEGKK